jgi:hypothetical protein
MTVNDEPTVAALRRLAASQAPDDSWQPDATAVLHRGRVLRARRRTATAGAGALVLALAIAVPATLAGHGPTNPVNPGQPTSTASTTLPSAAPSTAGTEPAPTPTTPLGPVSVNSYGQSTYAVGAGQAAVLDVPNLYAVNVPATSLFRVAAHGVGGVDVTVTEFNSHGVEVAFDASASHGKTATIDLGWNGDEQASDYSMSNHYPIPTFVPASTDSFQYAYLVGTVPSWLQDPTVELVSDTAFPLPDGSWSHQVQVPTFRAPTPDGRLMFVVTGAGNMALNWLTSNARIAIAFGGSRETFVPGCEQNIGAYGCDLIPMPAQYLTSPLAQFSPVPDQPTPNAGGTPGGLNTPLSGGTSWPDVAPAPIEIAPGVLAAAGAGAANSGGGFTFTGWAGATVYVARNGTDSDSLIEITAEKGTTGTQIVWQGLLDASRANVVTSRFDDAHDGVFVGGTVPPGLTNVRVFVTAPGGFTQAGGGITPVLEVPTFLVPPRENNPVPGDRPWFLVDFTGNVGVAVGTLANSVPDFNGDVIFAGSDGTIVDNRCDGVAPGICRGGHQTDAEAQAAYATIRQIVAQEVGPGR